tara:strand:+ start:2118 stop:2846 length:729 start_codon:yes stop_codon:yes gene_type:complete
MIGIILAAGRGSRLGKYTTNIPKGLVKIHGQPLIEWQINAFKKAGIKNIHIITGYRKNRFKYNFKYIHNKLWKNTNMFFSLSLADNLLKKNKCIISYSDIIYGYKIIKEIMNCNKDISISYDPEWIKLWKKRFNNPLEDAESFRISNKKIIEIGNKIKKITQVNGQYMGILKITPDGWSKIKNATNELSEDSKKRIDMTSILKYLLNKKINIYGVPLKNNWYEVDSISDLQIYEKIKDLNID